MPLRLHQTIIRYTEIARALGPEGVRSKMLADGMRKLNGGLVVIAKASGWPLTTVGEGTCAVFVHERPVALCSESERWRAGAALQLTLGAITGSKAVVLDRWRHTWTQATALGWWQGGASAFPRSTQYGGIAMQYGNAGGRMRLGPSVQITGSGRGGGMMADGAIPDCALSDVNPTLWR